MEEIAWVDFDILRQFMVDVFVGLGVPIEDAEICADVLIPSDKRGIDSHGVQRLKPNYYDRIRKGQQYPNAKYEIVRETSTTAVVEGNRGRARRKARHGACHREGEKALIELGWREKKKAYPLAVAFRRSLSR